MGSHPSMITSGASWIVISVRVIPRATGSAIDSTRGDSASGGGRRRRHQSPDIAGHPIGAIQESVARKRIPHARAHVAVDVVQMASRKNATLEFAGRRVDSLPPDAAEPIGVKQEV